MKTNEIRWLTLERDKLPAALLGHAREVRHGESMRFGQPLPMKGGMVLGYTNKPNAFYQPPALIVVDDDDAVEIFAWLKTYAPNTSPLSQFARVITTSDYHLFQHSETFFEELREDLWACVILGELLAQGEPDVDLKSLPLSRAAACFSTTIARAAILHGNNVSTRTCVERLRALEHSRAFVKRPVSINDLIPIWSMVNMAPGRLRSPSEAVSMVLDAAVEYTNFDDRKDRRRTPRLSEYRDLFSDSAEERVLAFNQLVNQMEHYSDDLSSEVANATIAAGVFLVGRSTSHTFLLRRLAKRWPTSFTWFALIAAYAGSETWDENWTRAVKGIERSIKSRFVLTDTSTADLSWVEYTWFNSVFDSAEIFNEFPKMFPKVLSVEVLPGAICQLRLASAGNTTNELERTIASANNREKDLEEILKSFILLSQKAGSIVGGLAPTKTHEYQTFELQGERMPTKIPRSRKKREPNS